jgi:hypothetical protein
MMMQLTPQQNEEIQKAKAAGEKRVTLSFTPEQKNQWRTAAQEELAGKEENIAHINKIQAAARQPGFFGDVRRAIILSRRPTDQLANNVGIDPRLLSDFRAAEAELPSAALDRLIEVLGLRLMQEIPR